MKEEIKNTFDKLNLKKGRYLLAFSGGPDSVFLLYMLSEYFQNDLKNHIEICYINYHDSKYVDIEEKLVIDMITSFSLTLHKYDAKFNLEKDKNFEDWARKYRYQLFKDIINEKGLDGLLTAHQLSDSIETYLLQQERKNLPFVYGLPVETTLYGIKILRPILSITKDELTQYLIDNNIPFYDDITNYDDHTKRNIIRKNHFSKLKQEEIQKEINIKNKELEKLYKSFQTLKYPISFSYYENLNEENKKRIIFYLLDKEELNLQYERKIGLYKEIYEFLKSKSSGTIKLSNNKYLYRTSKNFFIDISHNIKYEFTFDKIGYYQNDIFEIDLNDISKFNLKKLPVTIRNYQEGDQIGTNLKEKDVLTFLKKNQVPSHLINMYPVFLVDDKIVCVPFYSDIKNNKIPFKFKVLY